MADRGEQVREVRRSLTDARALCEKLGMLAGKGTWERQAAGIIVRCPVHNEKTPSCSVQVKNGTILWRCHSCDASGDALTMIAAVRGLNLRSDFRAVLIEAAELAGLHALVHELETGREVVDRPRYVPPPVEPEPERDYPPLGDVERLMATCSGFAADAEAAAWVRSRGIDPEELDAAEVAYALPANAAALPRWAAYRGRSWAETGHRCIVPMRDASGAVRSVRAGRVVEADTPKRLPPGGCKAGGLVMANGIGAAMLAGSFAPERTVIVEGEPDFMTWSTRQVARPTAILGIVNGSWSSGFAARIPVGSTVIIRTDHDRRGNEYAAEIADTLRKRCFLRRSAVAS